MIHEIPYSSVIFGALAGCYSSPFGFREDLEATPRRASPAATGPPEEVLRGFAGFPGQSAAKGRPEWCLTRNVKKSCNLSKVIFIRGIVISLLCRVAPQSKPSSHEGRGTLKSKSLLFSICLKKRSRNGNLLNFSGNDHPSIYKQSCVYAVYTVK